MFQIITDSSANLLPYFIDKYNLTVIPYTYVLNDIEYFAYTKDKPFDFKSYYDSIRNGSTVKTSMINTDTYIRAFEPILQKGEDIIYIGMSGGISSSIKSANTAKEKLEKKYPERAINIIDTLAASLGEGIEVIKAAQLKEKGSSIDEITNEIMSDLPFICQYFLVDDLKHLKRGGRISATSAIIGSLLNIKPILCGDAEGKIIINNKVRGKNNSLDYLAKKYDDICTDKSALVGIAHGDCEEDAENLALKLQKLGCTSEIIINCYEPVTGAHVGPGTVALFFRGLYR